jgi:hypothetical protein
MVFPFNLDVVVSVTLSELDLSIIVLLADVDMVYPEYTIEDKSLILVSAAVTPKEDLSPDKSTVFTV